MLEPEEQRQVRALGSGAFWLPLVVLPAARLDLEERRQVDVGVEWSQEVS